MNPTTEQAAIIDEQTGSFRIIAAAGSGKTTTLTLYVKRAIQGGLRDSEIAFITFTRLAAFDISKKVRRLIGPHTSICCGTFHRVMFGILRAAGIAMPPAAHLYDGIMEKHVEFVLEQLRSPSPAPALVAILRRFKLLVVDEFQDLDKAQFEFIALFKRIQPALRIIAIGDLAQNIYRFRGTSNEFLRRLLQSEIVPELKTFRLTTNFRSTAAILAAVNAVFDEEIREGHVLPMVAAAPAAGGRKPCYYEYARSHDEGGGIGAYEEAVVEVLVPIIKEAKASGKSVALIFPVIKCQSFATIEALLSARLPYTDFHRIAKEDATTAIVEIKYDVHAKAAPVQISSFHASKGLEWDIVALINVSDAIYDVKPGEVEDEGFFAEKTNLLYVGLTRAAERLLIFGNANRGGRHRLLARMGSALEATMDIELWGSEEPAVTERLDVFPIGVTELLRRVLQHPDLYARLTACSEHIAATFHRGEPLMHDAIYAEMKARNRELAFGTFVDWMIKRSLTRTPTLQCRILEVLGYMSRHNWFHKQYVTASLAQMTHAIEQFFDRAGNMPNADPMHYITAVRIIAGFRGRKYSMIPALNGLYSAAEARILETHKGFTEGIRDAYLLSQTYNLYARSQLSEIRAIDAPVNSYQGLPAGFDEFAAASVVPAGAVIRHACMAAVETEFSADIPVETESLIHGEIDMMMKDGIIEIKCGSAIDAADLRGSSSASNLLQLLAYVAMGRHGSLPFAAEVKWGLLINPLTATWERYDLTTWLPEESREFLACLVELQGRG